VSPVLTIAGVELRRFVRDRSNLFFVFLFPVVLVVLIGAQFGGGQSGRVAVAGPAGALRTAVTDQLRAEDVEVWYADAATARDQLARGRADAGLFLDDTDAAAYTAGEPVDLGLVGAPQATAQAVLQQVRTAVLQVQTRRSQVLALEDAGMPATRAERSLREARSSGEGPRVVVTDVDEISQEFGELGQFDLGAATQTLLFVFLSTLSGASALILTRRRGVLARTMAAPVSARQAVAGQALGRFSLAMVQGLYLILGTALFFGVDWGSWPATLLVLAAFGAVAAAASMVVGSVMDNDVAATGVGVGLGLVLAGLGGCMTPLEFFPPTLERIAMATPHAWAYLAFAEIQRHDAGVADVLPQLGVLLTMATVVLVIGAWLLRRSLDRAL
jgi:ABC-2 type transport system permease protein